MAIFHGYVKLPEGIHFEFLKFKIFPVWWNSDKAFTGAPHAFEGQGTAQLQFVREDAGDLQESP